MLVSNSVTLKKIRSYILRQGRLTPGQQYALDNYWARYGLAYQVSYDFEQVFGRQAPLIVEIGFGNGEALAAMAAANPDCNYLGIEVHRPGVGHLLMLLAKHELTNVRVYCHDAAEIIAHDLADESLAGVHLFFPDPWPKKKHHKRRIVSNAFLMLVLKKLQHDGYFHAATDWQPYAVAMLEEMSRVPHFINCGDESGFCVRPDYRPLTKFEQRGLRLGHGVWDLIVKKVKS